MKKIYLSFIAITFAINFSYAQWTTGTDIYNTNSGNVGIGITSPVYKLHVIGDIGINQPYAFKFANGQEIRDNGNGGLSIYSGLSINNVVSNGGYYSINGGNVGIGTTNPLAKLHVNGGIYTEQSTVGQTSVFFNHYYAGSSYVNFGWYGSSLGYIKQNGGSSLEFNSTNSVGFTGGNVGIGTTTPDQKLTVKGTIHSQEVIVDMNVLPDYVFKPSYHLPTLTEVKTYIDKNHHLPEMPSAEQVGKDGLSLGDMNAKLLKKVEELTLYLIQQKEESDQQHKAEQAQIDELKRQVAKLTVN